MGYQTTFLPILNRFARWLNGQGQPHQGQKIGTLGPPFSGKMSRQVSCQALRTLPAILST